MIEDAMNLDSSQGLTRSITENDMNASAARQKKSFDAHQALVQSQIDEQNNRQSSSSVVSVLDEGNFQQPKKPIIANVPEIKQDSNSDTAYKLFSEGFNSLSSAKKEAQDNQLRVSISNASTKNPDEVASAFALSKKIGVGTDIALRNKDSAQKISNSIDTNTSAMSISQDKELSQKIIDDPDFAAMAHNDILSGQLQLLSTVIRGGISQTFGTKMYGNSLLDNAIMPPINSALTSDAFRAVIVGMKSKDLNRIDEEIMHNNGEIPIDKIDEYKNLNEFMKQNQESMAGIVGGPFGMLGQTIALRKELAGYTTVGATIGSYAGILGGPFAEVTVPAGMAAGAAYGFQGGMAAEFGRSAEVDWYKHLKESGMNHKDARDQALLVGIGTSLVFAGAVKLMAAPIVGIFQPLTAPASTALTVPTVATIVGTYLKQFALASVGAFELGAGQSVVTDLATNKANKTSSKNATPDQAKLLESKNASTIFYDAIGSGLHTSKDFALLNALIPVLPAALSYKRMTDGIKGQEFLAKAIKEVSKTELVKRSPKKVDELLEFQLPEAVQVVYIDAGAFRTVLRDSGLTNEQIDKALPGVRDQLKTDALDVEIPTSIYLANEIARTDIGIALKDHTRVSVDAMDQYGIDREKRIMFQKFQDASADLIKKIKEAEEQNPEFKASAERLRVQEKANAIANGLSEEEAEIHSILVQAFAVNKAASMFEKDPTMTPEKFFAGYKLKVERERNPAQQVAPALSVVANDKIKAKAVEMGISESQISEAETLASSIADNDWVGLSYLDEETQAESRTRSQQDISIKEKYKNTSIRISQNAVRVDSKEVDARITTKSLEQALAEIEKVFEENRNSVGVRFITLGLGGGKVNVNLEVQLLSETQIREELSRRKAQQAPAQGSFEQAQIAKMDSDYMAAVKSGDVVEQQRMVDEAANAAGYTSPTVHHGSIAKGVTKFNVGKSVEVEGAIFFITNEDVAVQYTFERAYGDIISDEPLGDVTSAKLRMTNPYEYQAKGKVVDAIEMQRAVDFAKSNGYDGVIIRNIDDSIGMTGDMGDVYVVFNGNQIKSSDPITRDESGNVVPLSRRFNLSSPNTFEQASRADLGLGEQAAFNEANYRPAVVAWAKEKFGDRTAPDGSTVWQNFTEWFGDSKVVDAEGKPRVVYHGTQNEKMNEFSKTRPAYFSADKQLADEFADRSYWGETLVEGEVPTTISAYLSMKNPLVITTEREYESEMMDKASVGHLLDRGYDGIIYNPDDRGSSYFLTVSPTQIKSAVANTGEFSATDPNILRQEAVPATFYSALGVEVNKLTTKSANSDSWKQQIKGLIAKGVIKEREVFWSGLDNWLDLQEGKITKEQVQAFLAAGGVKVETETLGNQLTLSLAAANIQRTLENAQFGLESYRQPIFDYDAQSALEQWQKPGISKKLRLQYEALLNEKLNDAMDHRTVSDYVSDVSETKYQKYQLPDGKNYREVLVTLPGAMTKAERVNARDAAFNLIESQPDYPEDLNPMRFAGWAREHHPELYQKWSEANAAAEDRPSYLEPNVFRGSHWDQPNVLVHLRLNDRVDADGKRVLFVEEVQSDWGQQGREKGFANQGSAELTERLRIELSAAKQRLIDADKNLSVQFKRVLAQLGFANYEEIIFKLKDPNKQQAKDALSNAVNNDIEYINSYEEQQKAKQEEIEVSTKYSFALTGNNIPTAPFVETTSGWLELGLKQIMLEAVNGKYDRVAFVGGDQSVERYRKALTEAVDEVEINKNDDSTYTYSAIRGGATVQGEQSVSAKRINEVFGKAGSKQLLEQADANPNDIHTISSEDIEIGGEGMRKFYDTIVPQALNKMLKKLGGDKVETVNMITEKSVTQEQINAAERRRDFTESERLTAIYERQQLGRGISEKGQQQTGEQQGFTVTPALDEQVSQGLPLFQSDQNKNQARGTIDLKKLTARLLSSSDMFTLGHEMAHFYLHVTMDMASKIDASQLIKDDAQRLLNWFGIKDIDTWNSMTLDEQRVHHEAFAYNFEIYLSEGRSPNEEMRGVFQRFKEFMIRTYLTLKEKLKETNAIYNQQFGQDLPILTGESRQVMDRMIATEKQISEREAIDNFKAQWDTQEESGMDDARWAAYKEMEADAHNSSVEDLTKSSIQAMGLTSGDMTGMRLDFQKQHEQQRKQVRKEEIDKMSVEPIRLAERFLRTGKMTDQQGNDVEMTVGFKLDKESVYALYPMSDTGIKSKPDFNKLKGLLAAEGGLDPSVVAEMFGFTGGPDKFIRDLADLSKFKDELTSRVDARMESEFGDNTPEVIEEKIQVALHNKARERFVAVEQRWLAKLKTPVNVILKASREKAVEMLSKMRLMDIDPIKFAKAESMAALDVKTSTKLMQSEEVARKSAYTRSYNEQIGRGIDKDTAESEATRVGDEAAKRAKANIEDHKSKYGDVTPEVRAIKASNQRMLLNQLVSEAYKFKDLVAKFEKYAKKVISDPNRKRMGQESSEQIESILSRFGLLGYDIKPSSIPRPTLAEWISNQESKGLSVKDRFDPFVVDERHDIYYKEMTVDQFNGMVDAISIIEAVGKYESKMIKDAKNLAFKQVVPVVVESINSNSRSEPKTRRTPRSGSIAAKKQSVNRFMLQQQRGPNLCRVLDGDNAICTDKTRYRQS